MIVPLDTIEASDRLGHRIAQKLRAGDVVALSGELGAGKTTLARSIVAALGHRGEVPSPSFTLIECYEGPDMRLGVVHADFYRLEDPQEALELGLDDYRENAALIAEWPEKAGGFAQEDGCLSIRLEIVGQNRRAIVEGGRDWLERMP